MQLLLLFIALKMIFAAILAKVKQTFSIVGLCERALIVLNLAKDKLATIQNIIWRSVRVYVYLSELI